MVVGIDFDNTIVSYDTLFYRVAREKDAVPEDTAQEKNAVRDYLRLQDREEVWTRMQGYVYGARMFEAEMYPHCLEFLLGLRGRGHTACVVSHKTRYPFLGEKFDLHAAAGAWIREKMLRHTEGVLNADSVFFELTKEAKLERIQRQGCDVFVDDLPEILRADNFPSGVRRILFDPAGNLPDHQDYERCRSWRDVADLLRG